MFVTLRRSTRSASARPPPSPDPTVSRTQPCHVARRAQLTRAAAQAGARGHTQSHTHTHTNTHSTVFPVSAVVGAAVPAAVCRWGLCPCCPGVGRCLSGVYNHHHRHTHTNTPCIYAFLSGSDSLFYSTVPCGKKSTTDARCGAGRYARAHTHI